MTKIIRTENSELLTVSLGENEYML